MTSPGGFDDRVAPADHGVSNNCVLAILLLAAAVGYFTCVKPMADQVATMRRSMACMENRLAKLVKESDAAGQGGGLLAELARQRDATAQAAEALDQIEALNRRLAGQTRQIAVLAASEDLAQQTLRRIAEHRELLGAAELALGDASGLEQRLADAERQIAQVAAVGDRLTTLCSRLSASRSTIDEAHAASEDLVKLQQRLLVAARQTPNAADAVARLDDLSGRLAASGARVEQAEGGLARLESLQARLLEQPERTTRAVEALDVLTDLRGEVINAEGDFQAFRKVLLEVALMQPALDRAVGSLAPIRELATLRYFDADQLQLAARALHGDAGGAIAK